LVEDNLDVFAVVGADAMLVRNHTVTVTGGVLNIDFSALAAVGGQRHPIINAIEIIGNGNSNSGNGKQGDLVLEVNETEINQKISDSKVLAAVPMLYPNPAKDYTILRMLSSIDISQINLFELTGKLVRSFEGNALNRSAIGLELNVQGIENGVYMISVVPADGLNYRLKLVVIE